MDRIIIEFADGSEYSIDATETIAPNFSQQVTSNFVEEGVDIADHTRPQPVTLALTCFVGDAPLEAPFDPEDAGPAQERYYDPDADGPHREIDRLLERAAQTGEKITVDCGDIGLFEQMLITNYAPVWDNQYGISLNFSLQLQQVLTATTETTKLPDKKPEDAGKGVDPKKAQTTDQQLAKEPATRPFSDPVKRGPAATRAAGTASADVVAEMVFQENMASFAAPGLQDVVSVPTP